MKMDNELLTEEEKVNLLKELLEIEEKNDIGNLTSKARREFQQWVEDLIVSKEGE